jgi:hypothetical protein
MVSVGVKHRRTFHEYLSHTKTAAGKATQCTQPASIMTDLGERHVRPGDWIIEGENCEHYVVDDAFFQRTFAPIPWEPVEEGRDYGC